MLNRRKKILLILSIFALCLSIAKYSFCIELSAPEYTDEYLEWIKLPEEERKNYIEPKIFKTVEYSEDEKNLNLKATSLPSKYTCYYEKVEDQGNTGACWSFSAATSYESNYYYINSNAKKIFSNFACDFMTSSDYNPYGNGFSRTFNSGGNMFAAIAYAMNGMGIKLSSAMNSYGLEDATNVYDNVINNYSNKTTTKNNLKNVKSDSCVTDYIYVCGEDEIKEYVYKYGALSICTASYSNYFSTTNVYDYTGNNPKDVAYYSGTLIKDSNHEVTIVGWDDNYTNSAFPGLKGAYTVLNSWGTTFGNKGIYHIFYDDYFVSDQIAYPGVTDIEEIDYDNLYQYDDCGIVGSISSDACDLYVANVFSKKTQKIEKIDEVVVAVDIPQTITIYINNKNSSCETKNAVKKIKYTATEPGYHTVKLDEPICVIGDKFSITVKYPWKKYSDDGGFSAVPLEFPIYDNTSFVRNATSGVGYSYISADGETYTDLYNGISYLDMYYVNACIKVHTSNCEATTYSVEKDYNATDNTVTVKVISSNGFSATKPTWNLSSDKTTYSKVYTQNGEYSTTFTDIMGVSTNISFTISEVDIVGPEITIEKEYNNVDNTVTIKAISNEKLKATKPTWNLSNDKLTYSKVYTQNGTFSTKFSDIYGNETTKEFTISEIESGFHVSKEYDSERNVVKVKITSSAPFQPTKPTWNLSADKRTYSKEYTKNGSYTTSVIDNLGNSENVSFIINELDNVGPVIIITKEFNEEANTVLVKATSNEELKATKPTWNLSADKKVYSKTYSANGIYTTKFSDKFGNETTVSFAVNEIKSGFNVSKIYDPEKNTVKVSVTSKIAFQDTKPTWTLSADKKTYSKEYTANGVYSTTFKDVAGNSEYITFIVDEIEPIEFTLSLTQDYNSLENTVTVTATTNMGFSATKPTWTLSIDKKQYTKTYTQNGTYTTVFTDKYGNEKTVSFVINSIR